MLIEGSQNMEKQNISIVYGKRRIPIKTGIMEIE